MTKSKRYCITINVLMDVDSASSGKRIPWISFRGWKHGVLTKENRFIDTKPIVKMSSENMRKLGEDIFTAAKEMFYEDDSLLQATS